MRLIKLRSMKPGTAKLVVTIASISTIAAFASMLHQPGEASQSGFVTEQSSYPAPPILPEEQKRLRSLREAGLHGDHSQLPALVASLQNSRRQEDVQTTLYALAQLGDMKSLPAIDAFTQRNPGWAAEAKVSRARLVAEATGGQGEDIAARAAAKVNRFYQELGLSPTDLNLAASRYQSTHSEKSDGVTTPPLEVYAMRELADMVYRGRRTGYAGLPGVTQVDFSKDYGSDLKFRLAPLSREQRLAWLISDLAHKKVLRGKDYYELQLAADGGIPASRMAIAKLWEMDKRRDQYTYTGFDALFEILFSIRNPEQAPLIAHFRQDRDPWVKHYATWILPQEQFVPGY